LAVDDLLVSGAEVLLADPVAALAVQPVERDSRRALAGRVELDRDRNQAEGDRARAHRACSHGGKYGKTVARLSLSVSSGSTYGGQTGPSAQHLVPRNRIPVRRAGGSCGRHQGAS